MVRVAVCSQGDLADCFYIVESGQVRITMKRSRVGCKNDIVFFEDKSFSGVSYAILFLFLSWTDEKRAGRRGGRYCNVLSGPVLWGAGARHQQASSCVCLCCWKRQMLGYVSCYFGLFRTSGMLMWELSVQTQCLTFCFPFFFFLVVSVSSHGRESLREVAGPLHGHHEAKHSKLRGAAQEPVWK